MQIRPETPHDYAQITDIHIRAFEQRLDEALITALQRQRPGYDPELSLVAEVDGKVVGHAIFITQQMRLLGEDVRVMNLAPIAIDPNYQKQGIGGVLIEEAHRVARTKGIALSILLGHSSYYPRFGYITRVFGSCYLEMSVDAPGDVESLESRKPLHTDLDALHALWMHEEGAVDFALHPDHTLMGWLSPNPLIESRVYLRGGQVVAYTRTHTAEPHAPRVFLAVDADAARSAVKALHSAIGEVKLPLHPYSASTAHLGQSACHAWEAAMAAPLVSGVLDDYLAQVSRGKRAVGRVVWAPIFDFE